MVNGITTANEGKPNYQIALLQHKAYIDALKKCGTEVTVLDADESFPDSCFVEDTAILTEECAIITHPGAKSRQGEEVVIKNVLKNLYEKIEEINSGNIDGGDIMMVGNHFYIGLSSRTNHDGAKQMIDILKKYGHTASTLEVPAGLHLKSSMAYLENNNLLITKDFFSHPALASFNKILVEEKENYAANCIWVNGKILVPFGYEKTLSQIQKAEYETIVLDTFEFRKLDGGLSCLSLRCG